VSIIDGIRLGPRPDSSYSLPTITRIKHLPAAFARNELHVSQDVDLVLAESVSGVSDSVQWTEQ